MLTNTEAIVLSITVTLFAHAVLLVPLGCLIHPNVG